MLFLKFSDISKNSEYANQEELYEPMIIFSRAFAKEHEWYSRLQKARVVEPNRLESIGNGSLI